MFRLLIACATAAAIALGSSAPTNAGVRTLGSRAVATGPAGFSAMRVRFEHSLIADDGVLIANYERRFGISTVYVPLGGDDVAGLIDRNPTTVKNLQAMLAVGNVYLVVGDPAWLSSPTTPPAEVAIAARVARDYPRIAGVLFDLDPAKLPAWNGNARPTLVSAYLTLVATILAMPSISAFKSTEFVADTQFSLVHQNGNPNRPTILQLLQTAPGISAFALEVPGNSTQTQVRNAATSVAQITKPFSVVASTSKYAPNTYNGVAAEYLRISLADTAEHVAQANPNYRATTVDGWNDLYDGLQTVLPQPAVFDGTLATGPLVPRAGSTYLGGYVNAAGTGQSIAGTAAFEAQLGRPLAFNLHFYQWQDAFPTAAEQDDVARGRIPILAWNCGDTDANVANGADDAIVAQHADAIKAFGSPVMLRWFWEMNLDDANDPPRTQCWDPRSDLSGGYFSPLRYIAAWQHIRAIFASRGVTNVVWVWCVANAHGGASQYYPGDAEADWVALDDYDTYDRPFAATFYDETNALSQFQEKPFMIAETGAHAANQAGFFSDATGVLQSQFPWIRALGYFDSVGTKQNWVLQGSGFDAFATFANDPYVGAYASARTGARRRTGVVGGR